MYISISNKGWRLIWICRFISLKKSFGLKYQKNTDAMQITVSQGASFCLTNRLKKYSVYPHDKVKTADLDLFMLPPVCALCPRSPPPQLTFWKRPNYCSILHSRIDKFLSLLQSCFSVTGSAAECVPLTPQTLTRGHCPLWGDAHCMWLFNFAASLHLQHISAAVLPHYELSGQPVLHQVMDWFFGFFYSLDTTADVLRYHFCHRKPPIKDQTLFYLFIFLL